MKQGSSFRGFFALYFGSLIFCLGARVYLKLTAMDEVTGFYQGADILVLAFNVVLAAGVVLLYLLYLLRRTDNDYPVMREDKAVAFFALLCGLSIALYQLEVFDIPIFSGLAELNLGVGLGGIALMLSGAFGWLSAIAFIFVGARALVAGKGQMRGGLLFLVAGIWMMITLVSSFNRYTTLTTISDNLLVVLFMVFATLFFIGHARTLGGFARKDGRNYAIPSGLIASLCGFLLVIPNWVWAVANGTLNLPAPMLGSFESVFVLITSVYALLFVRHTCLGIRFV
ncbi:MAG: hypothetical protein FWE19_08090 [Oscillospiraceae bacterium]|nr:hypothetical protein [Oscillospiraceae bacterium]